MMWLMWLKYSHWDEADDLFQVNDSIQGRLRFPIKASVNKSKILDLEH